MRLILALFSSLIMLSSASAVDFSRVSCDHPDMIKSISDSLKEVQIEGGQRLSSLGISVDGVQSSETYHRSANKLICQVSVRVSGNGGTQTIRGRITYQQFNSGKLTAEWTLLY